MGVLELPPCVGAAPTHQRGAPRPLRLSRAAGTRARTKSHAGAAIPEPPDSGAANRARIAKMLAARRRKAVATPVNAPGARRSHSRGDTRSSFAAATRSSVAALRPTTSPDAGPSAKRVFSMTGNPSNAAPLGPELVKYRELVRGLPTSAPCTACGGVGLRKMRLPADASRTRRCRKCGGEGTVKIEPELLLWRWPHNHKAWGKVIAKMGRGWAAAAPHETWVGFKKVNNHGATLLRLGGANLLHNKRLLFETLLAAGPKVNRFIPETYTTHEAYTIEAAGGPGADASDTKKVQYDYEFSDACDHIWYFKRSFDDNGRGLVVFEGEKSEEELQDELDGAAEKRLEKRKAPKGPVGFKVRSRDKEARSKRKTKSASGLDGVFQRCTPYMMLWNDENDGSLHKFDLRVYTAVSPDGKVFVYKDAALRTAINEFDPHDLSPKTMVTHPCVIRPTEGWGEVWSADVFPKIVEGTAAILGAIGVGRQKQEQDKEEPESDETQHDKPQEEEEEKTDEGDQDKTLEEHHEQEEQEGTVDQTPPGTADSPAESPDSGASTDDSSDDSDDSEEEGEEEDDAVDRSIGEGRALLCGFDWLVVRRQGELWPMLLEINTSPQLMYPKKVGGEEWLAVLRQMMSDYVGLIVKPALCGTEVELGRWVPCQLDS